MRAFILSVLYVSLLCTFGFSQNQDYIDSLEIFIPKLETDTAKVQCFREIIAHGGLKEEEQILSFLNRGLSHVNDEDYPIVYLNLWLSACSQMAFSGHNEKAHEMYETLKAKAIELKENDFICRANVGLSRLLMDEGDIKSSEILLLECSHLLRDKLVDLEDKNALARSYNELSIIYRNKGELDNALIYLDSVTMLYDTDEAYLENMAAYSNRGRIFRFKGMNDSAKVNYLKAESLALKNGNLPSQSTVYNNLGNLEHIAGNYENAIAYYIKSIEIKEKTGNARGLAIGYHNVGAIKFDMMDWKAALADFEKSNKISVDLKFNALVVHNENKIGNVYYEQGDYLKAILHHQRADSIARAIDFKTGYITAKYHLGRDYIELNELDKANTILLEALSLAEEAQSKPNESSILVALATAYVKSKNLKEGFSLSESTGLKNRDIEQLLLRANTMADEMGYVENKKKVLEGLHLFYKDTGNYRADASVLQELISLNDSIYSEERTKAIADWETKYHVAEKDKEIFQLETERTITELKSKQARNLFGGVLILLCLIGLFGYYYLNQRTKKRQAQQRELFRSKLSSDLHDDVGTILTGLAMQSELLSNFVSDNMKSKAIEIADLSRDAMGRMRDTVWAIDSRKDTLDDLVDRMIDFAEQNLMTKDIKLVFNTNLDDKGIKIEPEVRQNIYLVFKEAIANILKHSDASLVKVAFEKVRNQINLAVLDNGNVEPSGIKTSGTGTSNIKARVNKLGGKVSFSSENGYKVNIVIPC